MRGVTLSKTRVWVQWNFLEENELRKKIASKELMILLSSVSTWLSQIDKLIKITAVLGTLTMMLLLLGTKIKFKDCPTESERIHFSYDIFKLKYYKIRYLPKECLLPCSRVSNFDIENNSCMYYVYTILYST